MSDERKNKVSLIEELEQARSRIVVLEKAEAEREQSGETLRESEERFRNLYENVNIGLYRTTPDGKVIMANPSMLEMLGFGSIEEYKKLDLSAKNLNPTYQREKFLQQLYEKGELNDYEATWTRPDGTILHVRERARAIRDEKGEISYIEGSIEDITERKKAEKALQESASQLRESQSVAQLGSYILDVKKGIWSSSDILDEVFGIDGKYNRSVEGWYEIIHPDQREEMANYFTEQVIARKQPFDREYKIIRLNDRQTRWVHGLGGLRFDDNGDPTTMIGTIQDITTRKQAEEALRKSAFLLGESQRVARLGSFELDFTVGYWTSSDVLDEVFGIDDKFERTFLSWLHIVHPDDRREMEIYFIDHVLRDKLQFDKEYRIVRINDQETRWVHELCQLDCDGEGNPLRMIGTIQDITERKKAEEERKRLEERFQEAQKKESLSILAGGIAHDFNNLLVGILGNASLALSDLSPVSPVREGLEEIERSAQRAADLTRQMLAYSGKGSFVVQDFDLSDLVVEMTHLLKASISKKVKLDLNLDENLPPIKGDQTQIRQLVMNLLLNASDALEDREGEISLTTTVKECSAEMLKRTSLGEELPPGDYICLKVTDTGCGMDEETIKKIFDPFFTTKFTGRGLGLAATLGIVEGHKGTIDVSSEVGKGTTFLVYLPFSDEHTMKTEAPAKVESPFRGAGLILVADDEPAVLSLTQRIFERAGYDVLTAVDGQEAVDIYRNNREFITLVLLDLTMPKLNGEEAFDEIRGINPDAMVLLSSGFSEQESRGRFEGKGLSGFIQKPYTPASLLKLIGETLNGNSR